MFQKIGLKRSIDKNARSVRKREMVSLERVKSLGILVADLNETRSAVDYLKKEFAAFNTKVSLIALNNSKEKVSGHVVEHEIGNKDFSWVGKDKTESLKKIEKTPFDYLFCLNTSTTLPLQNVLSRSIAKCRVGVRHKEINRNLYDLVVDPGEKKDWLSVSVEILKCINMLKSKERDEK